MPADLARILSPDAGLMRDERGVWLDPRGAAVSYPHDGSDACFAVEDASWWFAHRNAVLLAALRPRLAPPASLLDIGGGNGFVAAALAAAGYAVTLVEPSPAGVRNAQARGLERLVQAEYAAGLFRPGSFDAAGAFDVVEHVEDDVGFLRAARAALRPGGLLAVTVPALPSLFSADDEEGGHFRRYTRRSLGSALEAAGFAVEAQTYFMAALVPPVFLLRRLPSLLGLRRGTDRARDVREHAGGGASLLARLLRPEVARIAGGGTLPIGTSLLAFARAPR